MGVSGRVPGPCPLVVIPGGNLLLPSPFGCHSRRESASALAFAFAVDSSTTVILSEAKEPCSCSCPFGCHSRRESASALVVAFAFAVDSSTAVILSEAKDPCSCSCLFGCHSRRESASALAVILSEAKDPSSCSCRYPYHSRRNCPWLVRPETDWVTPRSSGVTHLSDYPYWIEIQLKLPTGL